MKKISIIYFCVISIALVSQANYFPLWHKQWAGTQFSQKMHEIDKQCNHIIAGDLNGTYDFDPSTNVYNLNSTSGKVGGAIMKLDSNGVFLWAKKIVAPNDIYISAISLDVIGNIYFTIDYSSTGLIDVDPSLAVVNVTVSSSNPSHILISLDKNGNYRWYKQFAQGSNAISIELLKIDRNNQIFIYASNNYVSLFDIDLSSSTVNVPLGRFFARYDTLGNYIWSKSIGNSISNPTIYNLDFDSNNNIIATGNYNNSSDFDYGTSTISISTLSISSSNNYFVMKTDAQVNYIWVNAYHSISNCTQIKILFDTLNNVFICGKAPSPKFYPKYNDTTYFHLPPITWTDNPFIIKYNLLTGNYINDFYLYRPRPYDFDISKDGKIYMSGLLAGTADFNPSASVYNLTGGVLGDAFMAVYDNNFNFYRAYKYTNQPTPDDYQCGYFIKSWNNAIYLYSLQNGNVNYGELANPYMINSTYAKALIKFSLQGITTDIRTESDLIFLLYPNPTGDRFYIEANTPHKLNVDLYDLNGRLVFSEIINDKSNIDVSNLNQGIYTATIKTSEYIINKKLVILR